MPNERRYYLIQQTLYILSRALFFPHSFSGPLLYKKKRYGKKTKTFRMPIWTSNLYSRNQSSKNNFVEYKNWYKFEMEVKNTVREKQEQGRSNNCFN